MSQRWSESPKNVCNGEIFRVLELLTTRKECLLTNGKEIKTDRNSSSKCELISAGLLMAGLGAGPVLGEGSGDQKNSKGTYIVNIYGGADRVCERIM